MSTHVSLWFSNDKVASTVESLMEEIAEAGSKNSGNVRYHDRQVKKLNHRAVAFGIGVFLFVLGVLIVPDFLPKKWLAKTENLHRVVQLIVVLVPVGFGVAARKRLLRANKRMDEHDSAVEKLVEQVPSLCNTEAAPLGTTDVNVLPLMETSGKSNLRCSLFGSYQDKAIALLEAEYTAKMSFNAESLLLKAHAEVVSDPDKEQFSRVRSASAVVFFEPLTHLPDMLIGGKQEPLTAFQKHWIKKTGHKAKDCKLPLWDEFEGFVSCRQTAANFLNLEFFEILKLRPKSMVQVIGGYLVVIPRSWSAATPMEMAVNSFDIQLDLDFAVTLYEKLSVGSPDSIDWTQGVAMSSGV